MALQNVLGNRTRLINRDVTVIQHRNATQRVACAMLVGFQVLGMKVHAIQFVIQAELFE